jgi:hypothetical protein
MSGLEDVFLDEGDFLLDFPQDFALGTEEGDVQTASAHRGKRTRTGGSSNTTR